MNHNFLTIVLLVLLHFACCEVAVFPAAYNYNYPTTVLLSVIWKND